MFERCLYFNLNKFVRQINKVWEQAFMQYDLSPAHAYLLRLVSENPGLTQQEIAAELILEKSTITRFVDTLEQRGFVKRKKTGRIQRIYPSLKTEKIAKSLNKTGDELYREMSAVLGEHSLKTMVNNLRKMSNSLND